MVMAEEGSRFGVTTVSLQPFGQEVLADPVLPAAAVLPVLLLALLQPAASAATATRAPAQATRLLLLPDVIRAPAIGVSP
jgi:hypothetical protein